MPVHVHKRAIRALGISESFRKGFGERSVLAGVVMRADMVIDGFAVTSVTIGGMDATDRVIELYKSLRRSDINLILLNGCVISWYNVIDLHEVYEKTETPLICVTYEESEGLEKYFMELFPDDWRLRVSIYHKNGGRTLLRLKTGHEVYVRFLGMEGRDAKFILDKFTREGAIPEPLRVARLLARTLMRSQLNEGGE